MGKKSASQIRRMRERAAARGEEYKAEVSDDDDGDKKDDDKDDDDDRIVAARRLQRKLDEIQSNTSLNTKERRSAKLKVKAIAAEVVGIPATELLALLTSSSTTADSNTATTDVTSKGEGGNDTVKRKVKGKKTPYIVFVGRLSFDTTKEGLFRHFQKELGSNLVTPDTLKVRLLTHGKEHKYKNRSRGMAFAQTSTPELMYECLKLHHTNLDGNLINVERSAGGRNSSETDGTTTTTTTSDNNDSSNQRRERLRLYRQEQDDHLSETVDKIIQDYRNSGQLRFDELDEQVIQLCKEHAASTVDAALTEYVEVPNRRTLDNTSSYFSHILQRVSVEGSTAGGGAQRDDNKKRQNYGSGTSTPYAEHNDKRPRYDTDTGSTAQKYAKFSMDGVDMSISSSHNSDDTHHGQRDRLFPSMGSRGRGRGGRGYMR